jgi:hypothetical protein
MSNYNLWNDPLRLPPLVEKPPSVIWTGTSSRRYELQIHAIGANYYERAGVYIFCKRARDGFNWEACYVGETDSFARRLTAQLTGHHRWQSVRASGATHICTIHVPGGSAERLRIETDLRQALTPPCNRQ